MPDASPSCSVVGRPFGHICANLLIATDLAGVDEPALVARLDDMRCASHALRCEVGRLLVVAPLALRDALRGRWVLALGCHRRWPATRLPRVLARRLHRHVCLRLRVHDPPHGVTCGLALREGVTRAAAARAAARWLPASARLLAILTASAILALLPARTRSPGAPASLHRPSGSVAHNVG